MKETPSFPPKYSNQFTERLFTCDWLYHNILTKVNGKIRMKLQTIFLNRYVSSNRRHGVGKSDLK